MPDTFVVNPAGAVVQYQRDRKDAFQTIHGISGASIVVYRGDPHDVDSPRRINPVARAARARRDAYFASLRNCIHCGIDEEGHRVYETWDDEFEKADDGACDDFTAPAPLAVMT